VPPSHRTAGLPLKPQQPEHRQLGDLGTGRVHVGQVRSGASFLAACRMRYLSAKSGHGEKTEDRDPNMRPKPPGEPKPAGGEAELSPGIANAHVTHSIVRRRISWDVPGSGNDAAQLVMGAEQTLPVTARP
jgi:hypothetical protein